MRYKLLGKTGLRVSEICLGTMTFGEEWGWGASKEESRQVFDAFVAAGGNFLDTANYYTAGTSEKYLGEFMAKERGRYVLATKYTLSPPIGDPNAAGNHRKNMVQSVEASLRRLQTDYIDVYWVHAWDEFTPVEELMRALDDLVRAGKVLYIGFSDAPAWVVAQANTLAELRGWTPFAAIQIQYSLIERTVERELLPMARALDIGVTAWSPLGGGVLTGKYGHKDASQKDTARYAGGPWDAVFVNARTLAIAAVVQEVAQQAGCTPSQVALGWLLGCSGNIIPIVGARRRAQLEDNLGCLDINLTADQISRLNDVSAVAPGFPHDFVTLPFVREIVYGGLNGAIDNHRNRYACS